MKANELMIGDLVYAPIGYPNCEPKRLEPIKIDFLSDKLQIGELKFAGELIEPIPLTAKLIEENGITRDNYEFDDGFHFFFDGNGASIQIGAIWFVHELQHAMRIVGLCEEADNFKIK